MEVSLQATTYSAKVPELVKLQHGDDSNINPTYEGRPAACHFFQDDGWLLGEYEWQVSLTSGRKKLLKQKSTYVLIYQGLSDCDEEYVHLYFSKIGRFTSYPYFRALFATNVAASGLTFPPLPSLTDRVD
jgi:hypothetical protein